MLMNAVCLALLRAETAAVYKSEANCEEKSRNANETWNEILKCNAFLSFFHWKKSYELKMLEK